MSDTVLFYALAGVGRYTSVHTGNGINFYQAGGGVELALSEAISLRGEVTGFRSFTSNSNRLFDATKATIGASYHF